MWSLYYGYTLQSIDEEKQKRKKEKTKLSVSSK